MLPGIAAAAVPCGLVRPVDELLHCDRSPADPSGGVTAAETEAPTARTGGVARQRSPRTLGLSASLVDPTRLLVRFAPRTSRETVTRLVSRAGGRLERRIAAVGIDVVRAEPAELQDVAQQLSRSPLVRSIEGEQLVAAVALEPNDPHWSDQRGLRVTQFAEAWTRSRGSPDVVVAVLDTGVSPLHPDLAGAVLPGYDALNQDADAADDHGHGTAVAGVIAARTNNAIGIAGVCWLCHVLPVKVLGSNGFGPTSTVAAGIVWAADHGADVINLSLGSPDSTETLRIAVRYANDRGALVVAAAGNGGVNAPFYPAAEPDVLAVAATDDDDRPYHWSNHGAWVALAAPGCLTTTALDGGYASECGTSFAAPLVAGLAGLARALQPTLPASAIAAAVRGAAVPIGPVVAHGRIDALRTLSQLPSPAPQVIRKTNVVRSTLTRSQLVRRFVVRTAGGTVVARLTRRDRRTSSLELLADGRALARASGKSPLRIARDLAAGVYSIRVRGQRGSFTLSLSYPASVPAAGPERPR
jgi:subtilisin family serine protease